MDAPVGSPPNPSIAEDLLIEKLRIEAAMRTIPYNRPLRTRYFAVLERLARSNFGAFFADFPEIGTPLMFRGATSDLWNLDQIFGFEYNTSEKYDYGDYSFQIPTPRRILDLGAYCGYTAVYFANRFPDAEIIAVEPPGPNFNALLANTAPYAKISCLPAAVWHERTEVRQAGCITGDWGAYFTTAATGPSGHAIPAYTIADILEMSGWDGADFIKCTIQGGMAELLAGPVRPWLEQATCVTTKPVAGQWRDDEEGALLAGFPATDFETSRHRDLVVFRRRSALDSSRLRPAATLSLIPPSPQRRSLSLANVAHDYHFYRFDEGGIELTPNPPGSPPATIALRLSLSGHSRFRARILTGPIEAGGVTFSVQIRDLASGATVVDARQTLSGGQTFEWNVDFAAASGPHEVLLTTERTQPNPEDSAPTSASFIDAQFI